MERCVYNQLLEFLQENNMLYELQSGFRGKHSTDTCLIHLFDFIRNNNSKGLYTGMVLLDLQKAFDTVDHNILCQKLEVMGVEVQWFLSYLGGRSQVVGYDGVLSDPKNSDVWGSSGEYTWASFIFMLCEWYENQYRQWL